MQDQNDPTLTPFFEAAQNQRHHLPEHARRRILLDAEALQPKPRSKHLPNFSLKAVFGLVPAGAALASLSLGIFVGAWQPDSVSSLAGFGGDAVDTSMLFAGGFETVFEEEILSNE